MTATIPKAWEDEPNLLAVLQGKAKPTSKTPVNAEALVDLEERLASYAEVVGGEFNVKSKAYAAKGDGETDDYAAITAVVEVASKAGGGIGGIVSFPPGTYITSKTIKVPPNVRLIGAGWTATVIKVKDGANCVAVEGDEYSKTGTKNGAVEQLLVDGNKANNLVSAGFKFQSQNWYFDKVLAVNCNGHGFDIKLSTETEQKTVGLDNFFRTCRAIGCEGKAFNIEAHDTTLFDCQSIQCKEVGFNWTVNGYMELCHSWCSDSTLSSATKTGYRLATAVSCVNCIAEGATERQIEIVGNVVGWIGGEIFNGASKPNAALIEFNGGASARILDPWMHEFGTGGAFKFTTNGESSIIRARCYDKDGNEVTNETPAADIKWDLTLGGPTKIGKASYFSRAQITYISTSASDAPNKTMWLDTSTGRLKFKDANGTSRDFQMAAMETTASANTISVSTRGSVNKITGTTEIKKITPTFAGHRIVLIFSSTAKLVKGLTEAENLKIKETVTPGADGAYPIVCDGTYWYGPA